MESWLAVVVGVLIALVLLYFVIRMAVFAALRDYGKSDKSR